MKFASAIALTFTISNDNVIDAFTGVSRIGRRSSSFGMTETIFRDDIEKQTVRICHRLSDIGVILSLCVSLDFQFKVVILGPISSQYIVVDKSRAYFFSCFTGCLMVLKSSVSSGRSEMRQ
mmetsp:Transcript_11839/g.25936  ORF Transcript_11839/g.25936 Transcript_11839/m.25936 type:complete len:121 (-) Transcript_11839:1277-1639(-)